VSEGITYYSVGVREVNLFGLAKQIGAGLEYTTKPGRYWRATALALDPNIAGTHIRVGGNGSTANGEKALALFFERPFYSVRQPQAFSTSGSYYRGPELFRLHSDSVLSVELPSERTNFAAWTGWKRGGLDDAFRALVRGTYNRASLDNNVLSLHRAFDNSVGMFGGVSSVRRHYKWVNHVDMNGEQIVDVGGMGSVVIGKISPIAGGLDNVPYLTAEARQGGFLGDDLYLFGSVAAGTGFAGRSARLTSERVVGSALLLIKPGAIAARIEQFNVWNWPRYVAQSLDKTNGLRGYDQLQIIGDNRLVANFEYRLFPILPILLFNVGMTAFYDVGAVWNQGEKITDSRFHNSAGIGFRVASRNGTVNTGYLRADIAYNFDDGKIKWINISTREFFNAFGSLEPSAPGPLAP
jgi:hypothetical protein